MLHREAHFTITLLANLEKKIEKYIFRFKVKQKLFSEKQRCIQWDKYIFGKHFLLSFFLSLFFTYFFPRKGYPRVLKFCKGV
jgi:hypothetical protein